MPDREPDQPLGDAGARAPLGAELDVRGVRRQRDERLHAAEARARGGPDAARPRLRRAASPPPATSNASSGPKPERHLARRDRVTRVRSRGRDRTPRHAGMRCQPARQLERVGVRRRDPQRQRLEAALDQPAATSGRGNRAEHLAHLPHRRRSSRAEPSDRARQQVAVAADRLGGAVHHDVGAERERLLADRRGEGVVDASSAPCACASPRPRRDVDHAQVGIGGRLDVEQPRARA